MESKRRALVAEDDLYTRKALATILEGGGWEVVACADGKNALANFRAGGFELVCLDIMMPQLSGYDVCRAIRALDQRVPVLFISAKSEEIDTVLGLELGADDFITKPFGVRELEARVRAVLRRSQASPTPAQAEQRDEPTAWPDFRFGPWSVKPAALRAFAGDQVAELSPRELRILRLLADQAGRVVSREEFFRHCWQLEQPPLSRTLDQHIARLRKKIEPATGPGLIQTAPGTGYRYEGYPPASGA